MGKLDSVRSESMEARYQGQRNETQEQTDTPLRELLKALVGVFKLGFSADYCFQNY